MHSESESGQSSDPQLLESRPRALPDTQHDVAASLHVTGDEVTTPAPGLTLTAAHL